MTLPNVPSESPLDRDPEFEPAKDDTYETLLGSYGIVLPASAQARLYIRQLWRHPIHRSLLAPYAAQLRADDLLD